MAGMTAAGNMKPQLQVTHQGRPECRPHERADHRGHVPYTRLCRISRGPERNRRCRGGVCGEELKESISSVTALQKDRLSIDLSAWACIIVRRHSRDSRGDCCGSGSAAMLITTSSPNELSNSEQQNLLRLPFDCQEPHDVFRLPVAVDGKEHPFAVMIGRCLIIFPAGAFRQAGSHVFGFCPLLLRRKQ